MNSRLKLLKPYPFQRLEELLRNRAINPNLDFISLAIGEPKHPAPELVLDSIRNSLKELERYPATAGKMEIREATANWASNRFDLRENPLCATTQVLPVNGTREALFAIAQVVADPDKADGSIGMPNPFYQIYEGAALLAGKQPDYFNCLTTTGLQPDWKQIDEQQWKRMELLYICSPGNPSGTYINIEDMQYLIDMAERYNFVIVSDECYSELYLDPNNRAPSILQACEQMGRTDYSRCLAVHSLSKRSNLPGLRSGFVAGDAEIIKKFLLYRTYHGSAMPGLVQSASTAAWRDEVHVEKNRQAYRQKYQTILPKLNSNFDFVEPEAAFYLWLKTPIDDQEFCQRLYEEQSVKVVPGSFLARDTKAGNPGQNHIRVALVAPLDECCEGIDRLVRFTTSL